MSSRLTAWPHNRGTAMPSAIGGLIMSTPVTNRPARPLARLGGVSGARGVGTGVSSNDVIGVSVLRKQVMKRSCSHQPRYQEGRQTPPRAAPKRCPEHTSPHSANPARPEEDFR